jgi:hypothetical protein
MVLITSNISRLDGFNIRVAFEIFSVKGQKVLKVVGLSKLDINFFLETFMFTFFKFS